MSIFVREYPEISPNIETDEQYSIKDLYVCQQCDCDIDWEIEPENKYFSTTHNLTERYSKYPNDGVKLQP